MKANTSSAYPARWSRRHLPACQWRTTPPQKRHSLLNRINTRRHNTLTDTRHDIPSGVIALSDCGLLNVIVAMPCATSTLTPGFISRQDRQWRAGRDGREWRGRYRSVTSPAGWSYIRSVRDWRSARVRGVTGRTPPEEFASRHPTWLRRRSPTQIQPAGTALLCQEPPTLGPPGPEV